MNSRHTEAPTEKGSTARPLANQSEAFGTSRTRVTIYALCGLAAVMEGFGLQSGGIAAPKFAAEFHITPDRVGGIFLLTSFGLALGASIGGWWGDRVGPGKAMAASIALFGIASIGAAMTPNGAMLAIMRTLTGLGLGGSLPNMIALLTNTGAPSTGPRRVTLSIAGISLGSGLIAFLGSTGMNWRLIFHFSGWIPLLVAAAVALLLPHGELRRIASEQPVTERTTRREALFGGAHAWITPLFWLVFFITGATSYLLINWLPTFLGNSGLTQRQVGLGMIFLAVGGALGPMFLSGLLRPGRTSLVVCLAYLGTIVGLGLLIMAPKEMVFVCGAIVLAGFFISGAQAVLFGVVGPFYPINARGTGVGSSVAIGRIGSGVGPALAGVMLAAGLTQGKIMAAAVPMLLVALVALLTLLRRAPTSLSRR
ncbi:MAG: transporter [Bradyrhizobium sp.]|nr:transporter [Bradyrhizobium sp.]